MPLQLPTSHTHTPRKWSIFTVHGISSGKGGTRTSDKKRMLRCVGCFSFFLNKENNSPRRRNVVNRLVSLQSELSFFKKRNIFQENECLRYNNKKTNPKSTDKSNL